MSPPDSTQRPFPDHPLSLVQRLQPDQAAVPLVQRGRRYSTVVLPVGTVDSIYVGSKDFEAMCEPLGFGKSFVLEVNISTIHDVHVGFGESGS